MLFTLNNKSVQKEGNNYIAHNATVIGDVILKKDATVWFNVVIRGDCDTITIGEGSNIQDGSILHTDPGFKLNIGENVTVGHKAMLHGCTIGDGSLIGINAVVLNGAKIGKNCIIGANTLITENTQIPDNSLVVGSPGKIIRQLDEKTQKVLQHSAEHYIENGQRYISDLKVQEE